MMTKENLLQELQKALKSGALSEAEVSAVLKNQMPDAENARHSMGIAEILYFLGGAVVFIGIVVLLGQRWHELTNVMKLILTMGVGLATYYSGLVLSRRQAMERVGQAFFLISALVLPVGVGVAFDIAGYSMGKASTQTLAAGILLSFYLVSWLIFRTNLFLLFVITYGTCFFYAGTNWLWNGRPLQDLKLEEYRALVTGASYLAFGFAFKEDYRRALSGALYGFGILIFLGAAMALGGWKPNQSLFWEALFPGLVLGTLFASVWLKSKALLTFGSLYLIAYLSKITMEYFKDSLGWPLSLVFIGFALIGIGYGALRLNREYLR